jgi:type IV secretory pathway VirB2 component (pilin)
VTLNVALALAIVSIILAGVELIRTKGQSLLAWSVLVLAVAVTFSRL